MDNAWCFEERGPTVRVFRETPYTRTGFDACDNEACETVMRREEHVYTLVDAANLIYRRRSDGGYYLFAALAVLVLPGASSKRRKVLRYFTASGETGLAELQRRRAELIKCSDQTPLRTLKVTAYYLAGGRSPA